MSNAKITYTLHRIVSLDRESAFRLLTLIDHTPDVDSRGTIKFHGPVKWTSASKLVQIEAVEETNGRIRFTVRLRESDQRNAIYEWLNLVNRADNGVKGTVRKSLVPLASMVRSLGTSPYYRVRSHVEFQDLLSFFAMESQDDPTFPCLISCAHLEIKRVTTITECDLLAALSMLTGSEYSAQ